MSRFLFVFTCSIYLVACSVTDTFFFDKADEDTQGFRLQGIYDDSVDAVNPGVTVNALQVSSCTIAQQQVYLRRHGNESIAPRNPALGSLWLDLGGLQGQCTDSSADSFYIVDLISPDLSDNDRWAVVDKLNFKYQLKLDAIDKIFYELVLVYDDGTIDYVPGSPNTIRMVRSGTEWQTAINDVDESKGQLAEFRVRLFFDLHDPLNVTPDTVTGENIESAFGVFFDAFVALKPNEQ
ncbi:hypothetical protein IC617_18300 [Neiella sp. HB171785]|uniref:Uncharacterized protein n=1 Tax=Neiella litorisoli TaxID=2771431 RepID=A0A8J6UK57_9GAMM|nr:hypothetical protein [Neiella litorisoli]MBD1391383.1 hypothetical protein [Neiella litorisoli]